jgi:hypothetical protein
LPFGAGSGSNPYLVTAKLCILYPLSEFPSFTIASMFRCVTLISDVIARLDLGVYTDDWARGRVLVSNGPPDDQLHLEGGSGDEPPPERQRLQRDPSRSGRARGRHSSIGRPAERARHAASWPQQLHRPMARRPRRSDDSQDDMIHIPGPGFDGLIGMSRIRQAGRNSVALARSIEETLGRAFDNAMAPKLYFHNRTGLVIVG